MFEILPVAVIMCISELIRGDQLRDGEISSMGVADRNILLAWNKPGAIDGEAAPPASRNLKNSIIEFRTVEDYLGLDLHAISDEMANRSPTNNV